MEDAGCRGRGKRHPLRRLAPRILYRVSFRSIIEWWSYFCAANPEGIESVRACHPEVLGGVRLDSSEYLGMTDCLFSSEGDPCKPPKKP